MSKQVLPLDPRTHVRHAIHRQPRIWEETNCYVDVWIELAHALGHEPLAALPFTFAIDFEGDQWTFFKFPLGDLHELFALDVQELALWRPLVAHLEEQVGRGRPVLVELDSFHLPDTGGTAYGLAHVKSTVAVMEIDSAAGRLGYFHNQGYFQLEGDDFRRALRVANEDAAMLPPYAELVKPRGPALAGEARLRASLRLLRKHLALAPEANPFVAFKARFEQDLGTLLEQSLDVFHRYSFATLRQYGACYELAATYLEWLAAEGERGLDEPAALLVEIAEGAKALQFQLARAMSRRKPLELAPLDATAEMWERALGALKARYG